jgi:large subunit ribosomal protein L19
MLLRAAPPSLAAKKWEKCLHLAGANHKIPGLLTIRRTLFGDIPVKTKLLEAVESKSLRKEMPHFEVGDTVDVYCRIQEGDKTRTQIFSGTVIARQGRGINESFTVRRIVGDEGVERKFPIHSPNVLDVKATRSGKVRRARLFFLRKRTGKAVKLLQRHSEHTTTK